MVRFNQKLFVAAAIAFVALTGYTTNAQGAFAETPSAPKVTAPTTSTPKPTVSATSEKSSKFADLQSIVSKTSSKVTAGKFIDAKDEFSKFEDAWKKVEDSLKKKSPDSYSAIEEASMNTKKELKAAKPSKTKLEASLQSLDKAIAKAAK
jgi:hypothetical protein